MSTSRCEIWPEGKRRRDERLGRGLWEQLGLSSARPMLGATNIHYGFAKRIRAIARGSIGAVHRMVQRLGLADEIDLRREAIVPGCGPLRTDLYRISRSAGAIPHRRQAALRRRDRIAGGLALRRASSARHQRTLAIN